MTDMKLEVAVCDYQKDQQETVIIWIQLLTQIENFST